ncbi:MAG: SagB family peptide dehydrogenase [Pandoraea sp.]|nr:SagB family peptide dehydrogenase [Pandoraea sp.]MDR3397042.1 SagB family peptide dehydrogenase [Pandoraea sp.]
MLNTKWLETALEGEPESTAWEQFHESSKTGHYDLGLPTERVVEEMNSLYESLPYRHLPSIALPDSLVPIERGFSETVLGRVTPGAIRPVSMSLETLRTLLHLAYGVTRDNRDNPHIHRGFRSVPSGGALYPLELYFYHSGAVEGLPPGIFHYSPEANALHQVVLGNCDEQFSQALVEFQRDLAEKLSVTIFITALFQRAIFKYRDKGYRFTLLEAGHVAQNINLSATALGLGVINLGGFHDRLVDAMLGLDGLNHSVLYLNGLCAGDVDGAKD